MIVQIALRDSSESAKVAGLQRFLKAGGHRSSLTIKCRISLRRAMSGCGPPLPTCAVHKVVNSLRYRGRARRTARTAVFDPKSGAYKRGASDLPAPNFADHVPNELG